MWLDISWLIFIGNNLQILTNILKIDAKFFIDTCEEWSNHVQINSATETVSIIIVDTREVDEKHC